LEQLLIHDFPISIQTKSTLVIRDLDLIKNFSDSEVIFSIGTLNDTDRKKIEPNSSSINDRLIALRKLNDAEIKTIVFFGPVYPTIKFDDIKYLIDIFIETGVSELIIDKFNLKPGIWDNIKHIFPNIKNKNEIINYYRPILNETIKLCRKRGLKIFNAFS
jgi:DNA repair photolyase